MRLRKHPDPACVVANPIGAAGRVYRGLFDVEGTEDGMLRAEIRALLEKTLDELPIAFRTVFVMQELEEMTVEQTAECLGIAEATVRSRLSRARSLFRTSLERDIHPELRSVFSFGGDRCERIVEAVLSRLGEDAHHT